MSKITTGALVLFLPLAFAMPALADQGPDGQGFGGRMGFSQMDLDGDGMITRAEMAAGPAGMHAAADTDGDGRLTREELIAASTARSAAMIDRMLARADTDGDGALSEAELTQMQTDRRSARMERMFDRLDADGDGRISAEEMATARDGKRQGGRDGQGARHGHGFWRG